MRVVYWCDPRWCTWDSSAILLWVVFVCWRWEQWSPNIIIDSPSGFLLEYSLDQLAVIFLVLSDSWWFAVMWEHEKSHFSLLWASTCRKWKSHFPCFHSVSALACDVCFPQTRQSWVLTSAFNIPPNVFELKKQACDLSVWAFKWHVLLWVTLLRFPFWIHP